MKRKIGAIVLTLAMVLTLACGAGAEVVEELTFPLTEEPIELTFLLPFNTSNGVIESFDEMGLFQYMEELTNVKIDHYVAGDTVMQFNLMVASGDLPDMAFLKAIDLPSGVASYIEDGTIIRLNELIDEYAPNIRRLFEEHPEWKAKMMLEDGTIYAIPKIKQDAILLNTQGLQVRSDWLERVGLAMPETIEDWDAVLQAFMEQDANGNGDPDDEIPFSAIALSALGQERSFLAMFALGFGSSDTFYHSADEVRFGPYDEHFYDVLVKLNEWYAKGYIDADYLSNDADTLGAKTTSNQVGSLAHHLNHGMAKFLAAWQSAGDTDFDILAAPYPKAPDGNVYSNVSISPVGVVSLVITSSNEHPIETVQWFDYLFSDEGKILYNYGIEGESYIMVDGVPQYTEEITNNPNGYAASTALYKYCMGLGDFPGVQVAEVFTETTRWPQQKAAYEVYSASEGINLLNINHTAEESEFIGKYWGDIETYCIESINKFIMGVAPINEDTFAEFRSTLQGMHIEEIIEMKQAAYDRNL